MNKKFKILLLVISFGWACEERKNSGLSLTIVAPNCSECVVKLVSYNPVDFSPLLLDSFQLDSEGEFSKEIIADKWLQSTLQIGEELKTPILLNLNSSLNVYFEQEDPVFSGSIGSLNSALTSSYKKQKEFENIDNKDIFRLDLNDFIGRINQLEKEFNSTLNDSSFPSSDQENLLREIQQVNILKYKYNYALIHYDFYTPRNPMPNELLSNDTFSDLPNLLNMMSIDYGWLVAAHLDMSIYPIVWPRTKDSDSISMFRGRADSLLKNSKYSLEVIEFLRAKNIQNEMYNVQNRESLNQLLLQYQMEYPNSQYGERLKANYNKLFQLKKGSVAPNIIGYNSKGEKIELIDYSDRVVVIDVWATWCKPCIEALPKMKEISKKYSESEVVFLFVSIDTKQKKWETFSRQNLSENLSIIQGESTSILSDYMLGGIPSYIVIDVGGSIFDANAKSPVSGKMEKIIDACLDKK